MLILTIDCCGKYCCTGIVEIKNDFAECKNFEKKLSKKFLASNLNLLVKKSINYNTDRNLISKIELIAVTVGPGSYSGLRASISFVKGLAFALNIPAYGINIMDKLHFIAKKNEKHFNILSICYHKNDKFFYRFSNNAFKFPIKKNIKILHIEKLIQFKEIYKIKHLTIIGDNAKNVSSLIKENLKLSINSDEIENIYDIESSVILAKIASVMRSKKLKNNLDPFYMKALD